MQRTLLKLTYILCLGWMTTLSAQTIPNLISHKATTFVKTTTVSPTKKLFFEHYLQGNLLDLSSGDLEDKDIPAISEFLKNHPEITSLNLAYNGKLTGVGLVPLAAIETLRELNLARSCSWCGGGLEAKDSEAFAHNKTLTVLNLADHHIGDAGAIALANNTALKKLDVSYNNLTDRGGVALAQNTILQELAMNGNPFGLETASAIAKNQTLHKLNLASTKMSDESAIALAENKTMTELEVYDNQITALGARALAKNQVLRKLELAFNHIDVEGARALAANKTLIRLSLGGDFFEVPAIADEIAAAFADNTTLREFGLENEGISILGVTELIKNKNLHTLWLAGNPRIGDKGALLIAQQAKQLTELWLPACGLTDEGAKALATMENVKKLIVSMNAISDSGAEVLANNTSLSELDLLLNKIHDQGALALAQNTTLYSLDVSFNPIGVLGRTALQNNAFIKHLEM